MKLTRQEFEALVVLALKRLLKFSKKKMKNVDVVVEYLASRDLLSGMGVQSPFQLLGLYQGVPLDRRGFYYGNVLPDKITSFGFPSSRCVKRRKRSKRKPDFSFEPREKRSPDLSPSSFQGILYLGDFRGFILETIP
jgi:hypothetical protein